MSTPPSALQQVAPGRARILDGIERRVGLTPTGLAVAGATVLGWLAASLIGSRVMFLMVYGVVLLLAFLLLSGRRKLNIVARRSKLPSRVREQQSVTVELEIEGRGRIGTLILSEDLNRLRKPVRLLVPSLPQGVPVTHSYSFEPALRGVYPVGPLVAIWSDPFGLTRKRTELLPPAELIVHPSTERVHDRVLSREWEDPPIRPPISKPWPTGFEFYGMRDYVSGDDPRRIVWRAVARTGRYLVREAEQGITDRVTIILDNDARHHSPGDPSDTFEAAVRAVASLAKRHLKDGFAVTIQTPTGEIARSVRAATKEMLMLDGMARIGLGHEPLAVAIQRVVSSPGRDTHNILVTPHLDARTAAMLRLLLERGGSMTFVHVVTDRSDPRSLARAGALGCELIQLEPDMPLEAVFRRATGAGMR